MKDETKRIFARPASWSPAGVRSNAAQDGMTLREHYAGLAMQGLLNNSGYHSVGFAAIADEAVQAADALINALNKG